MNTLSTEHKHKKDNNCILTLKRMGEIWPKKAQVKNNEPNIKLMFSTEYDDFLDHLLPFHDHPRYMETSEEMRTLILSSGWIAYNEKTIDIESKIISPICNELIYSKLPGTDNETIKWLAAETLVDEAYHILMVINTCRITREYRKLSHLKLPSFDLVNNIEKEVAKYNQEWQKKLVRLSACIVSEIFISDYLSLLSGTDQVQPINQITTEAHRQDELAHSSIFRYLTKEIFHHMNTKERAFFAQVLPMPLRWFASQELTVWESALKQLGFEYADEIIGDCRAEADVNLFHVDYSELIDLSNEIGLLDTPEGLDSFRREGLLN